jgi:type IV pilus assembly protein PilB
MGVSAIEVDGIDGHSAVGGDPHAVGGDPHAAQADLHPATGIDQHGAALPLRPGRLIGDIAVELGYASREDVEEAVTLAKTTGVPTGRVLVEQRILRHDQLAYVLAVRFGIDYIDLSTNPPDMGVATMLDPQAIKRYQAIPVALAEDGSLLLAMADPTNVLSADDVAMITGRRVRVLSASAEDVAQFAARLDSSGGAIEEISEDEPEEEAQTLAEAADRDAPVVKLVHSLVAQAVAQGASDIHINPEDGDTQIDFRIDGVLHHAATVRKRMHASVVSRIKIMADLDISERRVPQDGRFALNLDGSRVDIRIVTLPLVHGEGVVMRILDRGSVVRDLGSLGMHAQVLERFEAAIHRPNGAVLVTGPTGSGKSTTLYAALAAISGSERSLITIEDPVESRLPGVKQIQVSTKTGLTFQTGLRSMLRADPDVIMVGEIRDRDTAQIAVEAALTGHLVISTLHTRDAPSALGRLIDMSIEPFLIAAAVDCVVAQRLVRVLCPHCKQPTEVPHAIEEEHRLHGVQVHGPVGCPRCAGTGYRGRVGVYEVMTMTDELRRLVLERERLDELSAAAERSGMRRLRDDGIDLVRAGTTSIAEIERMTASLV